MLSKLTKLSEEYNVRSLFVFSIVACLIIISDCYSPYESGSMQVFRHEDLVMLINSLKKNSGPRGHDDLRCGWCTEADWWPYLVSCFSNKIVS